MNSLAELTINAHGGLARWNQFKSVSADLMQGGVLWPLKGQAGTLDKTNITVGLRNEWASHSPFGAVGRRSTFEPDRVAIEAMDGSVLNEPGVTCEELSPWKENGKEWRRLGVRYPDSIATHSSKQILYFDNAGLLKRHDYDVEIAGGTRGAHYVDTYVEVSGIKFPTERRIFARNEDASVNREPLVVSIDLSNIQLRSNGRQPGGCFA